MIYIQSVTDLITNSSSETFLMDVNEGLAEMLRTFPYIGKWCAYLKTEEDVKEYVCDDLGCEWAIQNLANSLLWSFDDMWNVLRDKFLELYLNKVYLKVDRDEDYDIIQYIFGGNGIKLIH